METTDIAISSEVSIFGWVILVMVLVILIFAGARKLYRNKRFKLSKLRVPNKIKSTSIDESSIDHQSVETTSLRYDETYLKYIAAFNNHIDARKQTNMLLKKLETTTCHNFKIIEKSKSLCKQPYDKNELQQRLNSYSFVPEELYTLERISKFYIQPLVAIIFGALIGAILVMAGLSLVTILGDASTGTSIQTLSGAAQEKATLAWFGGGSLATNGEGIKGGVITLLVIFFTPIIFLFFLSINGRERKIQKFKQETKKLKYDDVQLRNSNKLIEAEIAHIKTLYQYIEESYQEICKLIYPKGNITRVGRGLLSIMNRDYYNDEEAKAIDRLSQAINYVDQTSDKMR